MYRTQVGGRSTINVAILVVQAIVVAILVASLVTSHRARRTAANDRASRSRDSLYLMKPCPICGTLLARGERVHTVVYSGEPAGRPKLESDAARPQESLVHMFGCPHCYPPAGKHAARTCPVCQVVLPAEGHLVARMFVNRSRKHVHVLGCTECRGSGKNRSDARSTGSL